MKTTLLWFRRDLRLHDNPALQWACQHSDAIVPVYIHAPDEEQPWSPGGASCWWLHNSLQQLDKQLRGYGQRLHCFSGDSEKILRKLIRQTGANALAYNRLYEPHLFKRDQKLQQALAKTIAIEAFDAGLFYTPGSVLNNSGLPYRVYTAFYKSIRPELQQHVDSGSDNVSRLKKLSRPELNAAGDIDDLGLLDAHGWHEKLHNYWTPGEASALHQAEHFLDDAVAHYQQQRDIPGIDGTSRLSPHLHFGEITPQQLYTYLLPVLEGASGAAAIQSAEVFLKQLIWREFAHHVLWHFPHTLTRPMDKRYKNSFWRRNKHYFDAWKHGNTGVAIIDAGMKQLWETGWMHNRVRMVVSSFLTKNLGISWLQGAQWFWDTLVDADLANNNMGWQWVAGCGVDAAPYYRIFNPVTQEKRFDEKRRYINHWLDINDDAFSTPLVDLADSRNAALARYKEYINAEEH